MSRTSCDGIVRLNDGSMTTRGPCAEIDGVDLILHDPAQLASGSTSCISSCIGRSILQCVQSNVNASRNPFTLLVQKPKERSLRAEHSLTERLTPSSDSPSARRFIRFQWRSTTMTTTKTCAEATIVPQRVDRAQSRSLNAPTIREVSLSVGSRRQTDESALFYVQPSQPSRVVAVVVGVWQAGATLRTIGRPLNEQGFRKRGEGEGGAFRCRCWKRKG